MIGMCSESLASVKTPRSISSMPKKKAPRAPFATKSINTPRNSWRVRHEMMMHRWEFDLTLSARERVWPARLLYIIMKQWKNLAIRQNPAQTAKN